MTTSIASRTATQISSFSSIVSRKNPLHLPKKFRTAVFSDAENHPRAFLFETLALWEIFCRIDEQFFDANISEKSPVGEIIDELEESWLFSKEFSETMNQEFEKAQADVLAGKTIPLATF